MNLFSYLKALAAGDDENTEVAPVEQAEQTVEESTTEAPADEQDEETVEESDESEAPAESEESEETVEESEESTEAPVEESDEKPEESASMNQAEISELASLSGDATFAAEALVAGMSFAAAKDGLIQAQAAKIAEQGEQIADRDARLASIAESGEEPVSVENVSDKATNAGGAFVAKLETEVSGLINN